MDLYIIYSRHSLRTTLNMSSFWHRSRSRWLTFILSAILVSIIASPIESIHMYTVASPEFCSREHGRVAHELKFVVTKSPRSESHLADISLRQN